MTAERQLGAESERRSETSALLKDGDVSVTGLRAGGSHERPAGTFLKIPPTAQTGSKIHS